MNTYPPRAYRVAYAPVYRPYGYYDFNAKNTLKRESKKSVPIATIKPKATTSPAKANHKEQFVNKLLPYIERENRRLSQLRQRLIGLFDAHDRGQSIDDKQSRDLEQLAKRYRIEGDPLQQSAARRELIRKVDIIPASLALAQAANESGWGRSRFATEANNLFGIWTYDPNKGLKPRERAADKTHLVRKFDDLGESIGYYMRMLNSHPAYAGLREIRQQARSRGDAPTGLELALGLEKYSAKGKTYIQLIQQLIEQNRWSRLDRPTA